jgi:hypothetical protein
MVEKKKSDDISSLQTQFTQATEKVESLQKQLSEAQEEKQRIAEQLGAKLDEIRASLNGQEAPASSPTKRMTFADREALHVKRVKRGRGKPVPLLEIRRHYAEETGKNINVIAAQVKTDCEKSDQLTVKGKGHKATVVCS